MIIEANFQLKIQTQTAWLFGKVGQSEIPHEPARIEDALYVKRGGMDVMAYRVGYQSGKIGYVFLDESDKFTIVPFRELVNKNEIVSTL